MKIEINNGSFGPGAVIEYIYLDKTTDDLWIIYITTKEKYPEYNFGSNLNTQDVESFDICLSRDVDDDLSMTTISFIGEDEKEREMLEGYGAVFECRYGPTIFLAHPRCIKEHEDGGIVLYRAEDYPSDPSFCGKEK